MSFLQEISDEQLNRDHRSQLLGGTDMYTLMGHGYLEDGESPMDALMAVWERKRGLGTKPRKENEAMRAGVEQEPVVYDRLINELAQGRLRAHDERYQDARVYTPFRGLRIQEGNGDGYGIGGNMDAPLFDVSGEYEDPLSGETVPGSVYARRYAEEYQKIQLQRELNRARELDGEAPIEESAPNYQAPPYAGVIDIKATLSKNVFYDEIYNGVPPRFVIQTHHYLEVLREDAKRQGNGGGEPQNPELLGVYRYCLENNKTRFHEIEYDPELSAEMQRRADLFTDKCLKQGIPPNSSELRDEFYVYPVQGTQPEAELPDPGDEAKLKELLDKHDSLKERQKTVKGYEKSIKEDLGLGVQHVNGLQPGDGNAGTRGVFVDGRVVTLEKRMTNKSVTNEAAVSGALLAAGEAKQALSSVKDVLNDPNMGAEEKLAAISAHSEGIDLARLPDEGASMADYQGTRKVEASEPTISIKDNKATRTLYAQKVNERESAEEEFTPPTPEQKAQTPEPSTQEAPAQQPVEQEAQAPEAAPQEAPAQQPVEQEAQAPEAAPQEAPAQQPAEQEAQAPEAAPQEAPAQQPAEQESKTATSEGSSGQLDFEDQSLQGLESKPEPGQEGEAPDLVNGAAPDGLESAELPPGLLAGEEDPAESPEEDEPDADQTIPFSPFMPSSPGM